jgi:hypothetical protein
MEREAVYREVSRDGRDSMVQISISIGLLSG